MWHHCKAVYHNYSVIVFSNGNVPEEKLQGKLKIQTFEQWGG